jgi:hypothetical protein
MSRGPWVSVRADLAVAVKEEVAIKGAAVKEEVATVAIKGAAALVVAVPPLPRATVAVAS